MIVTIGEILLDCYIKDNSNKDVNSKDVNSLEIISKPGGSPFNVALGLARLGVETGFIGKISKDVFGDFLYNFIRKEGISTKFIVRSDKNTSLAYISSDNSKNFNYSFNLANSADLSLSFDQIPNIEILDSTKAIHFGSYSIVKPNICNTIYQLVRQFGGRKIISFDVNLRPTIDSDIYKWISSFEKFASYANIIKMSIEDFAGLYKLEASKLDHNFILDELLKFGAKLVIVTLDKDGVIAKTAKGVLVHQTIYESALDNRNKSQKKNKVIDVTGAGDSFMAAALYKLKDIELSGIENLTFKELNAILIFSQKAASLTISKQGADLPSLTDMEKLP